ELNSRTCASGAGPMNSEWSLYCGHTSMQQPHVMQRENAYAISCSPDDSRGPEPRSYEPSIGIHALTRFSASNIGERSTCRSRTTGNLLSGSSTIGPGASVSTSAVHDCR